MGDGITRDEAVMMATLHRAIADTAAGLPVPDFYDWMAEDHQRALNVASYLLTRFVNQAQSPAMTDGQLVDWAMQVAANSMDKISEIDEANDDAS